MRLPLPGPFDLAHAVRDVAAAAIALGSAATGAIALVPRLELAVQRVEGLLDRADVAVVQIEQVARDADAMVRAVGPLLADAAELVERIDPVLTDVSKAISRVDEVVSEAGERVQHVTQVLSGADGAVAQTAKVLQRTDKAVTRAVDVLAGAGGLVDNADHLLAKARGPLEKLVPVLERVAETMDPREVDAAVLLIDKLPEVLTLVEQDVLPLMRRLDTVGPELHALLELVEDLHNMVAGLPGMKLMRRRGENEEAE